MSIFWSSISELVSPEEPPRRTVAFPPPPASSRFGNRADDCPNVGGFIWSIAETEKKRVREQKQKIFILPSQPTNTSSDLLKKKKGSQSTKMTSANQSQEMQLHLIRTDYFKSLVRALLAWTKHLITTCAEQESFLALKWLDVKLRLVSSDSLCVVETELLQHKRITASHVVKATEPLGKLTSCI